jgi:hypothetical protein
MANFSQSFQPGIEDLNSGKSFLFLTMQFWFPGFLFAAAALLIPIVVHLFSFRTFRVVYFSDIRFLQELKEETRKQSRLRHILVLASRCLALLMLVMAFAKPYFPERLEANSGGQKYITVFLDNSFSMDAESKSGLNFEVAKARAIEIAEAYSETDRFRLLTQDFDGASSKFITREEFFEQITRVKSGNFSRSFQEISDRIRLSPAHQENTQHLGFIISDFQSGPLQLNQFQESKTGQQQIYLCPVEKSIRSNISVDSVWFTEPVALSGEQAKLMAMLQNHGEDESGEIAVNLNINGSQKSVSSVNLAAGEKKNIVLSYLHGAKGWQLGELSIADPETPFDNKLYFSYLITERSSVLQLSEKEPNPYISVLFRNDSIIRYQEMNQSDVRYQELAGFDLIIVHGWSGIPGGLADALNKSLEAGAALAFIPPDKNIDLNSYRTFLQSHRAGWYEGLDTADSEINQINFGNELFKGVFTDNRKRQEQLSLPRIKAHYKIEVPGGLIRDFPLLLQGGDPFVAGFTSSSGKIFLFASDFNDNNGNFHRHGLFVPSLFRMAFQRQNFGEMSVTSGRKEPFVFRSSNGGGDQMPKMINESSGEQIIPVTQYSEGLCKIFIEKYIRQSGQYRISSDVKDTLAYLSVNHDRRESEQNYETEQDLEAFCEAHPHYKMLDSTAGGFSKKVKEAGNSPGIWKIFLIFSLIFLFFELVLLKLKN